MKSVLVLGASGLLGREIFKAFKANENYKVFGTGNTRTTNDLIPFTYKDENQLKELFDTINPDIVINCIAIRKPDIVEKIPKITNALNIQLPFTIARECKKRGFLFIHISSDYVFDGTQWPYHPADKCNPLNKYGQTKLDAEHVVQTECSNYLIVRVPVLYGPGEFSESAILYLYNQVIEGKECLIDHIAKRVPTLTTDIAKTLEQFVTKHCSIRGIVHISSEKEYTKYEIALMMGTYLHVSTDHIKPLLETNSAVKRPYNCHLDCTELKEAGVLNARDFDEGLRIIFRDAGLM